MIAILEPQQDARFRATRVAFHQVGNAAHLNPAERPNRLALTRPYDACRHWEERFDLLPFDGRLAAGVELA